MPKGLAGPLTPTGCAQAVRDAVARACTAITSCGSTGLVDRALHLCTAVDAVSHGAGDLGGCEGKQLMRIRNATSRAVWITPWGLTRKHPRVWWPGCHRPGQDIVIPIPAQTSSMLATPLNPRVRRRLGARRGQPQELAKTETLQPCGRVTRALRRLRPTGAIH